MQLHNSHAERETVFTRMYPSNLQPILQSLLATLADIDFEHERERDKLSKSPTDVNLKIRILERLKAQHRERREPYIRQLAIIQARMLTLNS